MSDSAEGSAQPSPTDPLPQMIDGAKLGLGLGTGAWDRGVLGLAMSVLHARPVVSSYWAAKSRLTSWGSKATRIWLDPQSRQ
jgi:hypothetical protein